MDPKKLLVEFIGTFFLVLVVGLAAVGGNAGPLYGLAIGGTLMVMVYMGGHLSGGHYNPAVTLGVFLRGKCPGSDVGPYMATQIVAGVVAGLLANYLNGDKVAASAPDISEMVKVMLVEFLFTFMLVSTVLNTATSKKVSGNSYYGLAIGFAVVCGAYAGGAISGGAYNPAVATGLVVMNKIKAANIWMFFVPQLIAGAAAAFVYKFINPDEA